MRSGSLSLLSDTSLATVVLYRSAIPDSVSPFFTVYMTGVGGGAGLGASLLRNSGISSVRNCLVRAGPGQLVPLIDHLGWSLWYPKPGVVYEGASLPGILCVFPAHTISSSRLSI